MAKVMVVDDAVSDAKLMESILRAAGHQVVCYGNGEGLEDKVVTERPDVLLLDVVMPRRNGYEILRSLKKSAVTKGTPVVLVTSKNQSSDEAWGRRQGADDYLGKPFTPEQLVTMVRRFVP
ncbi:MAG TPA: response regulator [Methylomirabilota bacterium]|jgi:twitching motility two-component system response regulator PilH|nr:response regulator [Methylomirabilota bacterium]